MTSLTISQGTGDDRIGREYWQQYDGPIPAVGDTVVILEWPSRMADPDCDIPAGEQKDVYALRVMERRFTWHGKDISGNPKTSSVELLCEMKG